MSTAKLAAKPRTVTGSAAARRLRAQDHIPAVIYGHGREPQALTLHNHTFERLLEKVAYKTTVFELTFDNGTTAKTLIREIQRHSFKRFIQHVDFQELVAGEKVTMKVPLIFVGTATGVREGGGILIAMAEREGAIMNPKGLNEDEVFQHRKATGSILNFPGATNLAASAAALELECDILLPAALEGVFTAENAPRVQAKIILEGANGPTTPDADPVFRSKGMLVIPDIYCNAGGVTVSYFEWLKNLSHVRFGRMQKRHEQANELAMLKAIEGATGRTFTDAEREAIIRQFDAHYPTLSRELNAELASLMVFLQAPSAAQKTVKMLAEAPTQEEQIEYARAQRMLKAGWTPELQKQYFTWFLKAHHYKGGASFGLFVENIKRDAIASLSDADKVALKPIWPSPALGLGSILGLPAMRRFWQRYCWAWRKSSASQIRRGVSARPPCR